MERDKKLIETSEIKIKTPYLSLLDSTIRKVEKDIQSNRKSLRSSGIKIYSNHRTEKGIEIKYTYRGYHHETTPTWDVIRIKVTKLMEVYLCEN